MLVLVCFFLKYVKTVKSGMQGEVKLHPAYQTVIHTE